MEIDTTVVRAMSAMAFVVRTFFVAGKPGGSAPGKGGNCWQWVGLSMSGRR